MTIGEGGWGGLETSARFLDRRQAGRLLGERLSGYRDDSPLVLALPRGGVPVAGEVADRLDAPLDVWVVRKIGAPLQPELGMGAIGEGGSVDIDPVIVQFVGASDDEILAVIEREQQEIARRVQRFRGVRPQPEIRDRVVILVDDGIATGGTVRAAIDDLRALQPARLVLAVPVASADTLERLGALVDDVVCLSTPGYLGAIGLFYDDFRQVRDEEVVAILEQARERCRPDGEGAAPARPRPGPSRRQAPGSAGKPQKPAPPETRSVSIDLDSVELVGDLTIPAQPRGLIVFAHGSGSSRLSPRNRFVAHSLRASRLATLLMDLLTPSEEMLDATTARLRFDIPLLASRLIGAIDWLAHQPDLRALPIGLFGASTGAAAALIAAAERPERVGAVVSRGGRPDLAEGHLERVQAPSLLVVGGADTEVLYLNRTALASLGGRGELAVIPGASHLFEEPGALERVARLAAAWFQRHLPAAARRSEPASP